jgi:superfamily II DNA or RNA helicase
MAVRSQLTFVPGGVVPAGGWFAVWALHADQRPVADDPQLAVVATRRLELPMGEPAALATIALAVSEDGRPAAAGSLPATAVDLPVRALPVLPVLRRLAVLPPGGDHPAWARPSASVLGWSVASKLALELVAAGRLVPTFIAADVPGQGYAGWHLAVGTDPRPAQLAAALPLAACAVRRPDGSLWSPEEVVAAFLDTVADALAREGRRPELDPRRRGSRRPWPEMWAAALAGSDPTVAHLRVPADSLADEVAEWAAPVLGGDRGAVAHLGLRLELPADPAEDRWLLRALLRSASDASEAVDAAIVWDGPAPLELAGRRVPDPEATLIRGLAAAARLFPPIDRALSEGRPTGVELTGPEVALLLDDGVEALAAAGIGVEVPPELRSIAERRVRLRVRIGQTTPSAPRVDGLSPLGLSSLTDFRYELVLGDEPLSDGELAAIVAARRPLVRWRGAWIQVDHDEVDRLRELAGGSAALDLTEALAAALSGQHQVRDLGWVDAVADGPVGALIDRLRAAEGPGDAHIVGIDGQLRPYQHRGVAWLQRLSELGMGAVLADDMGLGKTIQAIALLTSRDQDRPHLVVCPTSVVGNWERELARFAPDLEVVRHHGPERPVTRRAFRPGHVVVTSYALLRRDLGMLAEVDWDVVVLDEAQQIKNPASKGARAARALPARTRVAMTGTPIENRLSELWSIVDVTNPGLLGSQRAFNDRFAVPIERWHDQDAASRLRRLVAPFVLRRRKDDPAVAVDLPPKQEVTVAVTLTREQARLYQATVDRAFEGGGLGSSGFERRGRILALLTALKQICNHPAQYLRDVDLARTGPSVLVGRSGKLARTTEILAELVDADERALVFTQFRQMGELLVAHLGSRLGLPEVPFLHGGVPLGARDEMVQRFQVDDDAAPVLLVSLRAGGTGLNLTRASHVLHFDRWWNPAVEDQATDRVHRIGQTRPVTVHTLVTAGTIEERIAVLLERKRSLADAVIGTGESWITELDDDELHDLVALSSDDLQDDDDADDEDLDVGGRPALTALPGGRA